MYQFCGINEIMGRGGIISLLIIIKPCRQFLKSLNQWVEPLMNSQTTEELPSISPSNKIRCDLKGILMAKCIVTHLRTSKSLSTPKSSIPKLRKNSPRQNIDISNYVNKHKYKIRLADIRTKS